MKPASAVVGPSGPVRLPPIDVSDRVTAEGELAVVVGRTCLGIDEGAGVQLTFGHQCRFGDPFWTAKELLDEGVVCNLARIGSRGTTSSTTGATPSTSGRCSTTNTVEIDY